MSPFLTPDNPPDNQFVVRRILLPADNKWTAIFDGLLLDLCYQHNWELDGEMTPQEMSDYFMERYAEFTTDYKETPRSDNADDLDGTPDEPWYEQLYDWIIEGFLAVTFTPQAAIVYHATVPKLRVAFRTGNIGALFKVLINGVEVWSGDSYGPIIDVIEQVFDTSALETPYTVRVVHNGTGEHVTGDAKLEFIRNEAVQDMIQTILRADPSGCGVQWSTDDGGNWNTIDLSACIATIATDEIQQAIEDGTIQREGGQTGPEPPPESGQCLSWHVTLPANNRWLCPSPVSAGDTISISNAKGAWWDGDTFSTAWYCPDGLRWLLIDCSVVGVTNQPADPMPAENHMRLIAEIAGAFYDVTDGFTVPSGIVTQPMFLQANDHQLYDNQGQVECDIQVCAAGGTFIHAFDFNEDNGGFFVPSGQGGLYGGQAPAHWGGTVVSGHFICGIRRNLSAARQINAVQININVDDSYAEEPIFILYLNNTQVARYDGPISAHTDPSGIYSHDFAGVNADSILVQIAAYAGSQICNIYNCQITGNGTDPF